METALYGEGGFFVRGVDGPGGHFRTSVHASPVFAVAVGRLLGRVDAALGHPGVFDLVDVGAGRGELLTALLGALERDAGLACGRAPENVTPRRYFSAHPVTGVGEGADAGDKFDNSGTPSRLDSIPFPDADQSGAGPAGAGHADAAQADAAQADAAQSSVGQLSARQAAPGQSSARQADPEQRNARRDSAGQPNAGKSGQAPRPLAERVRMVAVEKAPRPAGLDARIEWRAALPGPVTGLILATEWLDNVPLDVAERDDRGTLRRVLVDPRTGEETAGPPVDAADRMWCDRWWPLRTGERAEVGWPRDAAWSEAVGMLRRGVALAVDYGHRRSERPVRGTITGFRGGRQVVPVPDGSCDVTAHVAMDAVAVAGGWPYALITQREALRALGVDGGRPPLDLASSDPAAYLRALSGAGAAAELTDPDGLGGHWWLLQSVGLGGRGTMLG